MIQEILCKSCKEPKTFKTIESYYANRKKNTVCKKCRHVEHSNKLKDKKRKPFSNKWKRNLAIGHKKSSKWIDSMNTPKYKEIHRQKMLKMIKENKMNVAFNQKACDVFDFVNQKLNWNGLHAQNGKEKVVDVFYLDFYEPNLNLAIEWDEKHHQKAQHRKKDGFKQKRVTTIMGCEFYRVNEITKTVTKKDKNTTDRTIEIQTVLDEYYEAK